MIQWFKRLGTATITHDADGWECINKLEPTTLKAWVFMMLFRNRIFEVHRKGFCAGYELRKRVAAPTRDPKTGRFTKRVKP